MHAGNPTDINMNVQKPVVVAIINNGRAGLWEGYTLHADVIPTYDIDSTISEYVHKVDRTFS